MVYRQDDFMASAETVQRLVGGILEYHEATGEPVSPRLSKKLGLVGVHGTTTEAIISLATHGSFTRVGSELGTSFSLTPNRQYEGWSPEDVEYLKRAGSYALFQVGVEYADMHSAQDSNQIPTLPLYSGGAVIAFNAKALAGGYTLRMGTLDGYEHVPELDLHRAPGIESIIGIYAVDKFAYQHMQGVLINSLAVASQPG